MKGILSANTTTEAKLTEEDLMRAWESAFRYRRPPHRHLIAASSKPGTWTVCVDCGTPVRVPDGWGQHG